MSLEWKGTNAYRGNGVEGGAEPEDAQDQGGEDGADAEAGRSGMMGVDMCM